jgi:hypothetical protein
MITSIFVIVLMATVAILVFSLSGKMTKNTTIQYRTDQAALLARSYTELAVMAVINHDRDTNGNCIQDINGVVNSIIPGVTPSASASTLSGEGYNIQTRIYYIGENLPCSSSRDLNGAANIVTDYNNTGANDALAAIIVDTYVRYKDPAMVEAWKTDHSNKAPKATQIPWITYHTRRLLKI